MGRLPAGVANSSMFQSGSGGHTVGTGITDRGVKVATHLYVVCKLRTSGVIPPLLICVRGRTRTAFFVVVNYLERGCFGVVGSIERLAAVRHLGEITGRCRDISIRRGPYV
jgi:hypothetical protein